MERWDDRKPEFRRPPQTKSLQKVTETTKKCSDLRFLSLPRKRPGLVGAFCQAAAFRTTMRNWPHKYMASAFARA